MKQTATSTIEEICKFIMPFENYNESRCYMVPLGNVPESQLSNVHSIVSAIDGKLSSDSRITIDCGPVKKGTYQRRPGIHVDGVWEEGWRYQRKSFSDSYDQDMYLYSSHKGCKVYLGEYEWQQTSDGSYH